MRLEIKDGKLLTIDPDTIIGHTTSPLKDWQNDVGFS